MYDELKLFSCAHHLPLMTLIERVLGMSESVI